MDTITNFWLGFTFGAIIFIIVPYVAERYKEQIIDWLNRWWYD